MKAADSDGRDILQLNSDLVRMGFADGEITIDDAWQAGTTDTVERWQASLGEKQTGKIALGRIVFLPGAQRVTQLETACGSTVGGSRSGSGSGTGLFAAGYVQISGSGIDPGLQVTDSQGWARSAPTRSAGPRRSSLRGARSKASTRRAPGVCHLVQVRPHVLGLGSAS